MAASRGANLVGMSLDTCPFSLLIKKKINHGKGSTIEFNFKDLMKIKKKSF